MVTDGVSEFIREEGRTIATAVIVVLLLANLTVGVAGYWSIPSVTLTGIANLILAIVATVSLYIAWREFGRKTMPKYAINYVRSEDREESDRMGLQIVNTGASVIIPDVVWYSFVQKDEEGLLFSTSRQSFFEEVALEPGESATADIREDIVMFHIDFIYVRNWQGDSIKREEFRLQDYNRSELADIGGDTQVKVQRLFDRLLEADHVGGMYLKEEEFRETDFEELVETRLEA